MKCTNKQKFRIRSKAAAVCLIVILSAGALTGCGKEELPFAYDPDYEVSSYRVVNEVSSVVADSFAYDLCVVTGDVGTEIDTVDMSEATAAGLFDLNKNNVMYAKNVHERLQPASLTKIMTALVALKYGNPDDMITVTDEANITESGAVLCGLKTGDQLTLNQALHALLIHSANDAAAAIAGSIEGFAEMMNKEAVAIGATNSHFVNPHGLTADNHYVTAYDLYLIFNEALKKDLINEIIHMTSYETVYMDKDGNSKSMSLKTTNQYLNGNYKAPEQVTIIGGKTGTTSAAGNCLILLSKDTSGNPYISVILRSKEKPILYTEMTELLNVIH